MTKPRILIVDDDDAITQQLFWTLSDDYDVVTANDLHSAVWRATIYEPTLSILDLHLPPEVESPEVGLRILEYLKTHFPGSKVLIMTSASGLETRNACNAIGADGFLDKPFDTEQLLATMRRMAPRPLIWSKSNQVLTTFDAKNRKANCIRTQFSYWFSLV